MTSSTPSHPVVACVELLADALKAVADVDPVFMTAQNKAAALAGLATVRAQVDELAMRVLAESGDVADEAADRDAAAWLARVTRVDRRDARRMLALGRLLKRYAEVATAMRAGAVNADQAAAIAGALEALPSEVGADVVGRAETALVAQAGTFGPRELRTMGRRVLDVVAPHVAEDHERRLLEREEHHASSVTRLTTRSRGDGTSDIHIRASDLVTRRLLTYLEPFASPRRPDGTEATNSDDHRPYPQRLGHAFATFLETVDPTRLPLHAGNATTVVITMDHDTLLEDLRDTGVALIGDEPISGAEARRLACTASLIPVVLGGDSVPLDRGRTDRFYRGPNRTVMASQQPTCRAEGCDVPAAWCEAHHGSGRWIDGAGTDYADGVLLCSFHHHRAHDRRYDLTRLLGGRLRFNRRT